MEPERRESWDVFIAHAGADLGPAEEARRGIVDAQAELLPRCRTPSCRRQLANSAEGGSRSIAGHCRPRLAAQ